MARPSNIRPLVLIVDDNAGFRETLAKSLSSEFEVQTISNLAELDSGMTPPPDAAVVDLCLDPDDPMNRDGLEVLRRLRARFRWLPILIVTGHGDIEVAVDAMREGATDFLQKRASLQEIRTRLDHALTQSKLGTRVDALEHEVHMLRPREIIGNSARMQEIRRLVQAVADDGTVTVMIRGETGTGKEVVARAIHASGWRSQEPFVAVALNALPQSMIETELFGYEPGAFTDAKVRHFGYLEKAHHGVLFLDEIGDVDATIQSKLLRFLEEREFQRLGSTRQQRVDVQIIVATNVNLEDSVREGRLREDLYFRLKVHEILIPPLRERAEDIPLLVEHFLNQLKREGKKVPAVSDEAMRCLQWFRWPGNVRQLRNALESSALLAELRGHAQIMIEDLPNEIPLETTRRQGQAEVPVGDPNFRIDEALARRELQLTVEALRASGWRKTEAWKLLGYSNRFTMRRRIMRLINQYPSMKSDFPELADAFGVDSAEDTQ